MKSDKKRINIYLCTEEKEALDKIKSENFPNAAQSELFRYLIKVGLYSSKKEK